MVSFAPGEDPSHAATDVDKGWEAHGGWTYGGVQSGGALIIRVRCI